MPMAALVRVGEAVLTGATGAARCFLLPGPATIAAPHDVQYRFGVETGAPHWAQSVVSGTGYSPRNKRRSIWHHQPTASRVAVRRARRESKGTTA